MVPWDSGQRVPGHIHHGAGAEAVRVENTLLQDRLECVWYPIPLTLSSRVLLYVKCVYSESSLLRTPLGPQ